MEHFAELVSVLTYPNVPENIIPFVTYKARVDGVLLREGMKIILLRIVGTDSYYVIFPHRTTMEQCLAELKKAGISINKRTELYISKYII